MSQKLITSIRSLARLTEAQEQRMVELAETNVYSKGEKLLEIGQVCDHFWFIESGSVYQYYMDKNLDQIITGLYPNGSWALDHGSFTGRKPAEYFLEAYEETRTYSFSLHVLHHLIDESQTYLQLGKILENVQAKTYRTDQDMDSRYLQLMDSHPEMLQSFSLRMIASYLGMTPETLSRIRKRIANRS